jgi:uncharacterized lipoprotein YehR (DUF1307 family)
MKKLIIVLFIVALVTVSAVALTACGDKEETVTVTSISAKVGSGNVFYVGDSFDTTKFTITATKSDDTKVTVSNTNGFFYDKSDLHLVNGKYSVAGTFTLRIVYLDRLETTVEITVNNK